MTFRAATRVPGRVQPLPSQPRRLMTDGPTIERVEKGDVVFSERHQIDHRERVAASRSVRSMSVIDGYHRRRSITDDQRAAARRLYADYERGGGSRRLIALYGERQSTETGEISDKQAEAMARYAEAMRGLDPRFSPIVTHVVILDETAASWVAERGRRGSGASVEGMVLLRLGLDDLAKHYGLTRSTRNGTKVHSS